MPKGILNHRFVIGMRTRQPLAVDIIDIIEDAGTNGVALAKALARPDIRAEFAPEHIWIVRLAALHLRKDLDRFCRKVGVTSELERAEFVHVFAETLLTSLRETKEKEKESSSGSEVPFGSRR